jgi:Lysyl oxidase
MAKSQTMRAASRLLLSYPIFCLLAVLAAAVVVLGVLGPLKVVHAADVAIEGENFTDQPDPGTIVVTDSTRGYSGNQALKFTAPVTASHHTVTCSQVCDVVLRARGGQSGGSPSFSVRAGNSTTLTHNITSSALADYAFHVNIPANTPTVLSVTAGNVATGRNAFLDIATFPADGSSGTPSAAECADNQDNDGDGKVDYPNDPGCSSSTDNDEKDPLAATPLYPNLKTLKPTDLRFGTQTINGTTHKVLRFSNTVWNAGEGRLELRAKTVSTSSGKKTRVDQYVYDNAGGFTSKYVGDMVFHSSHNHFHFQDFARYELWTRADYDNWVASNRAQGQAIKRGAKTTFCIMDTDLVQRLPNSPSNSVYNSCSPSVQGMSVGWGDTYGYYLADQWIDLGTSSLPDGQYVLRSVADPSNNLYESANRSDTSREGQQENEAVTFFTVQGSTITIT